MFKMPVTQLTFWIALSFLVFYNICLVQSGVKCKIHADCQHLIFEKYCCGGSTKDDGRSCTYDRCFSNYCSNDSDCGDPSLCCRANACVEDGCLGCTNDSDCHPSLYCCKRSFPLNETVCDDNCVNKSCNWNDDCHTWTECCRSGKCVQSGCGGDRICTSNSECNFGQYCCKKAALSYTSTPGCKNSCVGETCSSDEDCGGPNECCISNLCVTSECSGCTTNENCSSGKFCCKKRDGNERSECSTDCIGKSCSIDDDCGGPGEICDSHNICAMLKIQTTQTSETTRETTDKTIRETTSQSTNEFSNSFPSWLVTLVVVSLF